MTGEPALPHAPTGGHDPVWRLRDRRPATSPPPRCDAVVIGGGIAGVSALLELRRRGVDAILLERDRLAAGASGRNAGFVLMGAAENYSVLVRRLGRSVAREVWHLTARNHAVLAETLRGAAGHVRRGGWTVAASPAEAASLQESEVMLREDGLPGSWHTAVPGLRDRHHGGLFNPEDGELDPVAAVHAVAEAGDPARIFEGVGAHAVEAGSGTVRVHLDRGEVSAGSVVLATNAYTPSLLPSAPIAAIRGQMLATAPERERVVHRPSYSHWGYRYWRQLEDGRLLVGGYRDTALTDEVGTEPVPTSAVQRHLDEQLRRLGADAEVTHRWAGIMGFTPDGLPLVGPAPGQAGVHVCAGFSGHGWGFAMEAARQTVASLLDGSAIPGWLGASRAGVWPARQPAEGSASTPTGVAGDTRGEV